MMRRIGGRAGPGVGRCVLRGGRGALQVLRGRPCRDWTTNPTVPGAPSVTLAIEIEPAGVNEFVNRHVSCWSETIVTWKE